MKRKSLLIYLQLLSTLCFAQSGRYGNEWIRHEQTYYRIPVVQQGLYRLTGNDLQQAGVPINSISPAALQVFRRGVEQAISVTGGNDGRLDAGDYVEFIGTGNDGQFDKELYRPAGSQPHPYYSMFSDTAAYFLTWRLDGRTGKRMAVSNDTDGAGLSPEPYHMAEIRQLNVQNYTFANSSPFINRHTIYFEEGEGWSGPPQNKGVPYNQSVRLDGWVSAAPVQPQIEILFNGLEDYQSHEIDVLLGSAQRLVGTASFTGLKTQKLNASATASDVSSGNDLSVTTLSRGNWVNDRYAVSYIQVRYPQNFDMSGVSQRQFELLPNSANRSLVRLTAPSSLALFDLTDASNPSRLTLAFEGNTARTVVSGTSTARRLWASTTPLTPVRLERVVFRRFDPRKSNYLVVSHESLMKPAGGVPDAVRAFAGYRASATGGRYDTLVVSYKELMNQFSYGERTSLALRRFADYMLTSSFSGAGAKYLLLLGRANIHYPARKNPNQYFLDLVPSITYLPGSDIALTEGLAGFPENVPAMPTGRINTLKPQEIIQYLDKIREYESLPGNLPWRKEMLHLSGGQYAFELPDFQAIMNNVKQTAIDQFLGANVTTRAKQNPVPKEKVDISDVVNRGIGMLTFFGHTSPVDTDTDMGHVSNPAYGYNNKGKYPFMFFNGCGIGNVFYGATNSLSTDWMLTPDKGAIAVLAHGWSGYSGQLDNYTRVLYATQLGDAAYLNQTIGIIHREVSKRMMQQAVSDLDISNVQQIVLQGDPAIRIFPIPKADFQLNAAGVQRLESNAANQIRLKILVQNAGRYRADEKTSISIQQRQGSAFHTVASGPLRAIANRDSVELTFQPPAQGGFYMAVVDGDKQVSEMDEVNNGVVFNVKPDGGNGFIIEIQTTVPRGREAVTPSLLSQDEDFNSVRATPNPFSTSTRIRFTVTDNGAVGDAHVELTDLRGNVVRALRQPVRQGANAVEWDGTGNGGVSLPSGMYLFRIRFHDGSRATGKVILAK